MQIAAFTKPSGKKQPVNSAPSNKVLDAVHRYLSHAASTPVAVLSPFNDLANDLANVPSADIIAFGSSLAQLRSQPPANAVKQIQKPAAVGLPVKAAPPDAVTTSRSVAAA